MASELTIIREDKEIFDDALINDVVLTLPRKKNEGNGADPGRLLVGLPDMEKSSLRVTPETVEGDDMVTSNTLHVLGKLGIGTSEAQAPLDIHGDFARLHGFGRNTQFRIFNNSTVLKGEESECIFRAVCGTDENDSLNTTDFGCSPCNPVFVRNSDQKRLVIDLEGRVGINILEPQERLHIIGDTIFEGSHQVQSHTILSDGTSPAFRLVHDTSSVDPQDSPDSNIDGEEPRYHHAVEVFVPSSSEQDPVWCVTGDTGYTGLNTTFPQERLHVNGAARVEQKLDALGGLIVRRPIPDMDDPSDYPIARFFSGSASSPTMLVAGGEENDLKRVGIATASPQANLHVAGDALFEKNIFTVADENIMDSPTIIPDALSKVKSLNGYTFEFSEDGDRTYIGLKAQEVESVLPEAIKVLSDGSLTVSYGNLVALAFEAIKELSNKIDSLS